MMMTMMTMVMVAIGRNNGDAGVDDDDNHGDIYDGCGDDDTELNGL
jgi:hypothetical protein